jgi:hypothetical protein
MENDQAPLSEQPATTDGEEIVLTSASNVGKTSMASITAAEKSRQQIRTAAHREALAAMKCVLIEDGMSDRSATALCEMAASDLRRNQKS